MPHGDGPPEGSGVFLDDPTAAASEPPTGDLTRAEDAWRTPSA